jgi:replication factor C large subunit
MGTARRSVLPYLSAMTHHCKPRELTVEVAARYDLDEKDLSFVTGSGESTNKVESIVADARERREEGAVAHSDGAFEEATRNGENPGDGPDDGGTEGDDAGNEATSEEPATDGAEVELANGGGSAIETGADAGDGKNVDEGDDSGEESGDVAEDSQSGLSDFY